MKGSLTVESALVFPIILGTIVFIILSGFYMHDKAVILGAMNESISIGALNSRTGETMDNNKIQKYFNERINKKTLSASSIEALPNTGKKEIGMKVKCNFYFGRIYTINKVLTSRNTNNILDSSYSVTSPEDNIRNTLMLKEKINNIKQ